MKSYYGNQYAIVFSDYLIKWSEVFATKDQTAPTIATLFVQEAVLPWGSISFVVALWGCICFLF